MLNRNKYLQKNKLEGTEETKFAAIRAKLAIGQAQLNDGKFIDDKDFLRFDFRNRKSALIVKEQLGLQDIKTIIR